MDDILEVIIAFLFAGALSEWKRRRDLKTVERIMQRHYAHQRGDVSAPPDAEVTTLKWLMSSDVRLALKVERLRKQQADAQEKMERKKTAAEAKLREAERRRVEKLAFLDKAKRVLKIAGSVVLVLGAGLLLQIIKAHASPAAPRDRRDHIWVEITRPVLVCLSTGDNRSDAAAKERMQLSIAKWLAVKQRPASCYVFERGKQVELNPAQPIDAVDFTEYCNDCSPYASDYFGPSEKLIGKYTKRIEIPPEFEHYFR